MPVDCLNFPQSSKWRFPERCKRTSGVHCGAPWPCASGTMWDPAYCDETAWGEHAASPHVRYRVSTLRNPADSDVYGERIVGVTGPMRFGVMGPSAVNEMTEGVASAFVRDLDRVPDLENPYGAKLQLAGGMGCRADHGVVRDRSPCVDPKTFEPMPGTGPCRKTRALAAPHKVDEAHPDTYGRQLNFLGSGPCDPQQIDPIYSVSIFGTECRYCPDFLWTLQQPCFDCSYDYPEIPAVAEPDPPNCDDIGDRNCSAALCNGRPNYNPVDDPNLKPECEAFFVDNLNNRKHGLWNPDWHMGCDIAADGTPTRHHCEECAWQRLKGHLIGQVLSATQATQRIPMVPISPADLSGCGEFGWHLRTPLRLDPHECTWQDGLAFYVPCGNINTEVWCPEPSQYVWCQPALFAAWDAQDPENQILEASIRFEQAELCNPVDEPCNTNPCRDVPGGCQAGQPHPPAFSEVIMRVTGKIKIKIVVRTTESQSTPGCELCPSSLNWTRKEVVLEGEFDEYMTWGDLQPSWDGYRLGTGSDYIDYGWGTFWSNPAPYHPQTFPCEGTELDPDAASPPGMCMNPFSNQGKWTDAVYGDRLGPWYHEPPKACASHVTSEGSGGDQGYCAPMVKWKWSEGNKVDFTAQCWDVEAVRNRHSCVDGVDDLDQVAGSHRYECTKLECRRGCTIGDAQRDISPDPGVTCDTRFQPCIDFPQNPTRAPFAVPWSCGQCMKIERGVGPGPG